MSVRELQRQEHCHLEQKRQYQPIDSVPSEIWFHVFSFLDTKSLLSVSLTQKTWNHLLKDDLFWKQHFSKNFYRSLCFYFHSWRESTLSHFYWRKEVSLHPLISYKENELEFCELIDDRRALVKVAGFLKILHIRENRVQPLFTFPIVSYKNEKGNIIAIFSDHKGYGTWSKISGTISYHADEKEMRPVFKSNRELLPENSQYDLEDACYLTADGRLNLREKNINISCINEGFQPIIYTYHSQEDLLLIGCFPGRVQIYRSTELVSDYQEENGKYIFHLSVFGGKVIMGYQDTDPFYSTFSFRKQLVIYDIEGQRVVKKLSSISSFVFRESMMIYSNESGDIISLDLNTLIEQNIFIPQEGRGDFPNNKIVKMICRNDYIWALCSNGKLYLHHTLIKKSVLLRKTRCVGVAPSGLDLFIMDNYLVVKENFIGNELLEIFNIENLNDVKIVSEKHITSRLKMTCFGGAIVLNSQDFVEILRGPIWDYSERLEDTVCCIKRKDQLIVTFKSGEILFFDRSFQVTKMHLESPIIHANVFKSYLFCVDNKGGVSIVDINSRFVVFKQEQLLTLDKEPLSLETTFGQMTVAEQLPRISQSEGTVLDNAIAISVNHSLLVVNINSRKHFFEKKAFSGSVKFLPFQGRIFCLGFNNETQGVIEPDLLTLEKFSSIAAVEHFKICYDCFLLIVRSDGTIELIDLISKKTMIFWKLQIDFKQIERDFEVREIGNNRIIILCKNTEPVLYNLLNRESEPVSHRFIYSWHLISDEFLLLILENGQIITLNLIDGSRNVIDQGLEECLLTGTKLEGSKIILFYQKKNCQVGITHYSHFRIGAKFIDLEKNVNTFFTEMEKGFQLMSCDFVQAAGEEYLILSFLQDHYDYNEYLYKILNLNSGKVELEYQSLSDCQEWITCNSQFLLYLDERGALYTYDVKSKKEILLLNSQFVERRALIEKHLIQDKIFLWLEEEEPYDSDGYGPPRGPNCCVFDPNKFSLISLEEGVYKNEKNLLVVDKNGSYFLFDLAKLSLIISSNIYHRSVVYYDNIGDRIILGTNDVESFRDEYDDYNEEKFSLHFWDLKQGFHIDLAENQMGNVLSICCFDAKIFVWITNDHSLGRGQDKKLLIINEDHSSREVDFTQTLGEESRIEEIRFIEDKTFIKCDGRVHFLNNQTLNISQIPLECDKFKIENNILLIESRNEINIFRIAFHELVPITV